MFEDKTPEKPKLTFLGDLGSIERSVPINEVIVTWGRHDITFQGIETPRDLRSALKAAEDILIRKKNGGV